jgi:hypothetical protein
VIRAWAAAIAVLAVAAAGLVAVGFAFGNVALLLPRVPPRSGMDRFLLIVFPAACMLEAVLASLRPRAAPAVMLGVEGCLRLLASVLCGWVLLWGSVYLRGEPEWLHLFAWAVVTAAVWQAVPRRQSSRGVAAAVSVALLATGVLIVLGGWLKGGLGTVPFAVATAGLGWRTRDEQLREVVVGCGTAAVVSLLALGHFFGRVSDLQAACVAGVLVGLTLALAIWRPKRSNGQPQS